VRGADPRAEKKPVDIDEAEFGPSVEPPEDLASPRIADDHGESAKIAVSDLAEIVSAKTIGDHCYVGGAGHSRCFKARGQAN
jgi:hypothetical protein